ncbi:MAG: pyruvate:ferredoxin (flavodoxin) oxidoreductase, partial [Candidatus Aminicenantes bacterium]|nr:pyruvate:ferredoxin (flavodoxin) oxidoreductase [Candidatus Aminicenantes bacterium]
PNMYKIAGELTPSVIHVAARSLAAQGLSIFGDHSDVMSIRQTGYALLASNSVQEVMDLALISHAVTLEARLPILHFFDGFRISHEVNKIELISDDVMRAMIPDELIRAHRARAMTPDAPTLRGTSQNPDVYFQGRETVNKYYDAVPAIVQDYMNKVAELTGRSYHLFDYVGDPEAEKIIIAMGSSCDTIEKAVAYMNARGEKVGAIKVRLYRPFSVKDFVVAIPSTVKNIAVLDRTKEPGSIGEPLYLDIATALRGKDIKVIGGRYGLSSKEFTPSMVRDVFEHLKNDGFHGFTVGIDDDVTNKSIKAGEVITTEPDDIKRCIFWGLGSDGTVGANKNSIKIIGDNTDMNAQGYFSYDSKKSGGITISYLRFGESKILSTYLITKADFIALHNPAYIGRYDILKEMKDGGTFLLNSNLPNDEVFYHLTRDMQETIIRKKLKFYNIDALKIANEVGLGNRINTVMQAAFFKVSGVLEENKAIALIKDSIKKSFESKGDNIVKMNWAAVDNTSKALNEIDYPKDITKVDKFYTPRPLIDEKEKGFSKDVIEKIMHLRGDSIPVSAMPLDGKVPTGTAMLEKRGIAPTVPKWLAENCIQCNQCSFVCPHAAIRAKQIDPEDLKNAPESFNTIKSSTKNEKNLEFKIQIYTEDCTGCGNCIETCPSKEKSLVFSPIEEERELGEVQNAIFFDELPDNVLDGVKLASIKGTQFKKPLFEFSGACAGCGETAYVKLATQLFGDKMIIANATGCSSIYGGTFPTTPYTKDKEGRGPAWANSLFEDNAEYGFGMRLAVDANRRQLKWNVEQILPLDISDSLKNLLKKGMEFWDSSEEDAQANASLIKETLESESVSGSAETIKHLRKIVELKDYFIDKSVWCFGGDGWAYDIGYGGLDHVLASGKNINVLVLDTEVYSNTGGQSSKATPLASVAKFAAAGKRTGKKDLGLISMSYGNIYVASISLGANMNQAIKAFTEAESYNGPSLIIAYSPCIAHGIDMSKTVQEEKLAVQTGYWPLYRYNPALAKEDKNPFVYESKDPTVEMMDFLMNEGRYTVLKRQFPEVADGLYKKAIQNKKEKHEYYKKLKDL